METVQVSLTSANARKLLSQERTLLKADQLGHGSVSLHLKPRAAKRVKTAMRKSKGIVLLLEGPELHASRESISQGGSLWGSVKKLYHKAKPEIRKGVKWATKKGLHAAASAFVPEAAPLVDKYSDKLVDKVGDVTGAYGLSGGSFAPAGRRGGSFRGIG